MPLFLCIFEVEKVFNTILLIVAEDRDDFLNCFSFVKTGACLAGFLHPVMFIIFFILDVNSSL